MDRQPAKDIVTTVENGNAKSEEVQPIAIGPDKSTENESLQERVIAGFIKYFKGKYPDENIEEIEEPAKEKFKEHESEIALHAPDIEWLHDILIPVANELHRRFKKNEKAALVKAKLVKEDAEYKKMMDIQNSMLTSFMKVCKGIYPDEILVILAIRALSFHMAGLENDNDVRCANWYGTVLMDLRNQIMERAKKQKVMDAIMAKAARKQAFYDKIKTNHYQALIPVIERELSLYPSFDKWSPDSIYASLVDRLHEFEDYCDSEIPEEYRKPIKIAMIPNIGVFIETFMLRQWRIINPESSYKDSPFIMHIGKTGRGKSISVYFTYKDDDSEFFATSAIGFKKSYNTVCRDSDELEEMANEYVEYETLIIDDFTQMTFSKTLCEFFFENILEGRNVKGKTTVFTMQEGIYDFVARVVRDGLSERQGEAWLRRLTEFGTVIDFDNFGI